MELSTYQPQFQISANNTDITAKITAAFIDLTITDNSGNKTDTLTLKLDGEKVGKLPPVDAVLRVSLGFNGRFYEQGAFVVDGLSCSGFPETVTITASSAPLGGAGAKASLQSQRTQSWSNVTLDDIIKTVATRNSLTPLIAESLKTITINHLDQTSESDLALMTRLARQYSAVSKVSNENWMLLLEGAGTNASGTKVLPIKTIHASECESYSYTTKTRTKYKSAFAKYHDTETGKKGTCSKGEGEPSFRIAYSFPNQAEAQAAVNSRLKSISGESETLNITMPANHALLNTFAEGHVQAVGFRDEIANQTWNIKTITKSLSDSGMKVSFECNGMK